MLVLGLTLASQADLNTRMHLACSSAHRCASPACQTCAWRYCGHVSRRILADAPRLLTATTISAQIADPADFCLWRVAVRNLVNHRRWEARWWASVGIWAWLSHDCSVRGTVSLGSITSEEFLAAFNRSWPTTIKPIAVETVRVEVWGAVQPGVIAEVGPGHGRYQRVRAVMEPQRSQALGSSRLSPQFIAGWMEPMPILV